MQLAVDHQAAGDAPPDEHAGHVVRERRRAPPVLGEHREIHVVLDEDPAREVVGEAAREIQVGPLRDDHRPDPARVVDHARHADADGPDGLGPQTVVGDEAAQPPAEQLDPLRAAQLLGDVLPFTRDDLAVEPGEHQHDLAEPDVDTDDMPGLGPETQPTGRAAGVRSAGGATASAIQPCETSSSTSASTVGRDSPVAPVSWLTVCGLSLRSARSTTPVLSPRNAARSCPRAPAMPNRSLTSGCAGLLHNPTPLGTPPVESVTQHSCESGERACDG